MLKPERRPTVWTTLKVLLGQQSYVDNVHHAKNLIDQGDQILRDESKTDKNWQDALKLYQAAGELGSGIAYEKVGDLYADGK